jgi:acyl carrier protein
VSNGRHEIEERVRAVVAEALDRPLEEVQLHSSLIDDLGAESIDFLDIVFRLENVFGVKLPDEEIWKGSLGAVADDPAALEIEVGKLRARTPEFRWDRFPGRPAKHDLPRLITVQTVVEFLEGRLAAVEARPGS